jgi:hypothetical protein
VAAYPLPSSDLSIAMPQARLACLLLTLAPAGALALHTGVRAPLPAATRRASLRLAADEATGKEDDEAAAEGFNWPLLVAGSGTALGTGIHWPAFTLFVSQWQDIANSGVTGDEFNAPLQFWVFFAAMHPLLKPAIWIGEVLHSSPGPAIELFGGDFMPISFIVGNVAVLGLLAFNKRLSGALNVALLGLFINFVGLGLEGALDNGEYNLALNDGVKGCPTYQQVKQPSMADFDVKKYTGRWYEHAFHDYTQFSDVYDTTLDIELSADGTRWLDDFALRGPSPKAHPAALPTPSTLCTLCTPPPSAPLLPLLSLPRSRGLNPNPKPNPMPMPNPHPHPHRHQAAPASWEKSPVANGAHYFL